MIITHYDNCFFRIIRLFLFTFLYNFRIFFNRVSCIVKRLLEIKENISGNEIRKNSFFLLCSRLFEMFDASYYNLSIFYSC